MFKFVILTAALLEAVAGQVINIGSCPNVTVVSTFNATSYLGTWYEYARYFAIFEVGSKCDSATYTLSDDGTIDLVNKAVINFFQIPEQVKGTATAAANGQGILKVKIFGITADYNILETDYTNYAAVFSCSRIGILNARFAWILTRDRSPTDDVIASVKAAFDRQNISTNKFIIVNQDKCN